MKKRSLLLGLSSVLFLTFILGFIIPWWMGKAIERTIVKNFHRLENIYPQYHFELKNYEKSIYHSKATVEISSKSLYKNSPKILLALDENIQHGPFILDSKNSKFHFKLAKIESQVQLKETPFIRFDQESVQFTSFINYLWKLDFLTNIEKLSGKLFLSEKMPCYLEIENLFVQGAVGLSHLNLAQDISIQSLALSRSNEHTHDSTLKIKDLQFHNEFDSSHSILDRSNDSIHCSEIEVEHKKNTILFNQPQIHLASKTENKSKFLEINGTLELSQILVNDLSYGPLNTQFAVNHFPKDLLHQHNEIERLLDSGNEKTSDINTVVNKLLKENPLEVVLKDFTCHVQGGPVSLKGKISLQSNNLPTSPLHFNGKLISSVPKQALNRLLKNGEVESFLESGFLLEKDNTFDAYCVFKNNAVFVNGSNIHDQLFTKSFSAFKRPLNKEQRLLLSLLEEDNELLNQLIGEGISLNRPLTHGKYPIHIAAHMGNVAAIKSLLEANVPVDITDDGGNTALYWASRGGHTDIVRILIARNASVNAKNVNGWTPLQEAAENGHLQAVLTLLEKGAKINTQDNDGRTALFWAAKEGHVPVIELLLEKGADPTLNNVRNLTPLDIAREYGRDAAVSVLKKEGRTSR